MTIFGSFFSDVVLGALDTIDDCVSTTIDVGLGIAASIDSVCMDMQHSYNSSRSGNSEGAYEREERAQKIFGDANEILGEAEYRLNQKAEQLRIKIKDIRRKEAILLAKCRGTYDRNKNYNVNLDKDMDSFVQLKRGDFYSNYDHDPFTLKGLFTRSYADAEVASYEAMSNANAALCHARCVDRMVDSLILHMENVEKLISNEEEMLASLERSFVLSNPNTERSVLRLMNTLITFADFKIDEEHAKTIEEMRRLGG